MQHPKDLIKQYILSIGSIFIFFNSSAQFDYTSNSENSFGKVNPDAPKELHDYDLMIGCSDCISISRKPGGEWEEPVKMTWTFKYIMNGMAIQDETLKEDGIHSGSIRLFHPKSDQWLVHYYSTGSISNEPLRIWRGGYEEDDIVLYREQKAPNGLEGAYRITFHKISSKSFEWLGEWVSKDGSIVYPSWKISCKKKKQ